MLIGQNALQRINIFWLTNKKPAVWKNTSSHLAGSVLIYSKLSFRETTGPPACRKCFEIQSSHAFNSVRVCKNKTVAATMPNDKCRLIKPRHLKLGDWLKQLIMECGPSQKGEFCTEQAYLSKTKNLGFDFLFCTTFLNHRNACENVILIIFRL